MLKEHSLGHDQRFENTRNHPGDEDGYGTTREETTHKPTRPHPARATSLRRQRPTLQPDVFCRSQLRTHVLQTYVLSLSLSRSLLVTLSLGPSSSLSFPLSLSPSLSFPLSLTHSCPRLLSRLPLWFSLSLSLYSLSSSLCFFSFLYFLLSDSFSFVCCRRKLKRAHATPKRKRVLPSWSLSMYRGSVCAGVQ